MAQWPISVGFQLTWDLRRAALLSDCCRSNVEENVYAERTQTRETKCEWANSTARVLDFIGAILHDITKLHPIYK